MTTFHKLISSSKITTSSKLIYRNFTTKFTNSSSSISKSPIQKPFIQNLKPCSNPNGLFYPSHNYNTHFAIPSRSAAPLFPAAMKSFHRGYSMPPHKSKGEWKQLYLRRLKRKKQWFGLLKKKSSCRLLLKSRFLQSFHSYMLEKDLERPKEFRYKRVCLGSNYAELNKMRRHFYQSVALNLISSMMRRKDKNLNHRTRSSSSIGNYKYSHLLYCCSPTFQLSMKNKNSSKFRKLKRIELPTHYMEANYKTLKAVVFYDPHIEHIPDVSSAKSDKGPSRR